MKRFDSLTRVAGLALAAGLLLTPAARAADRNLAETAQAAGGFATLLAAAEAAGLVPALTGDKPLTVFAPTDEAFGKLPEGTVAELLKPENKAKLKAILLYHVVPGRVTAADVIQLKHAETAQGQYVDIKVADGEVHIDGAKVIKTDIAATNGVIHVIDAVILPTFENLQQVAEGAGQFATLIAAAKAAGLWDALAGEGPLTIFAPTDEAFARLPAGTVENLLKPENRDKLAGILKYHVLSGRVMCDATRRAESAETLHGQSLRWAWQGEHLMLGAAKVIKADIEAANGVIHVIDHVMLPAG